MKLLPINSNYWGYQLNHIAGKTYLLSLIGKEGHIFLNEKTKYKHIDQNLIIEIYKITKNINIKALKIDIDENSFTIEDKEDIIYLQVIKPSFKTKISHDWKHSNISNHEKLKLDEGALSLYESVDNTEIRLKRFDDFILFSTRQNKIIGHKSSGLFIKG